MPEKLNSRKSRQRDRLIIELLKQPTIEKAAEAAGISTVTAWRMRKTSEFDDQYRSARLQVFSQALARSQGASNIAIAVLLRIMTDSQESSHSRVRAALAVIKQAKEASELDMAQQCPSTGTDTSSRPDLSLLSDQELSTAYDIALIAKGKKAS